MFQLLKPLVEWFQPLLVPICCLSAWLLVLMVVWSLWSAVRDTAATAQRLHRIPCSACRFFTSSYHLKCTVHPAIALSEDAINCPDFEPTESIYRSRNGHHFQ